MVLKGGKSPKRRPRRQASSDDIDSNRQRSQVDAAVDDGKDTKSKQSASFFVRFAALLVLLGIIMITSSAAVFREQGNSKHMDVDPFLSGGPLVGSTREKKPKEDRQILHTDHQGVKVSDTKGERGVSRFHDTVEGGSTFIENIRKKKDNQKATSKSKIATAFQEPPTTLLYKEKPLPRRSTSRSILKRTEFPEINACSTLVQDLGKSLVNAFFPNSTDPWLPWIHDYFIAPKDDTKVVFVGQNRRNCFTGTGTEEIMEFWAPQIALFQPVPVVRTDYVNGTASFRLYERSDPQQFTQTKNGEDCVLRETLFPETRFICRFHWQGQEEDDYQQLDNSSSITLSEYPFNYEYVSWRKRQAMFKEDDLSRSAFWISQLIFSCPIPPAFQVSSKDGDQLLVDVVPIRTPPRSEQVYLTPQMVGPQLFQEMQSSNSFFNIKEHYGNRHVLPSLSESGRIANLPVCSRSPSAPTMQSLKNNNKKPYRLVACTWTSASYHRRGEDEDQPLSDNTMRLREWLLFHRMVGFDHVVIYDNTPIENYNESPLHTLIKEFDPSFVTHQAWSAVICNNNRPHHRHPGDRSSQYAAEASCRERYGPLTDWMAFIDTDEYLVPMTKDPADANTTVTWKSVLDDMERRQVAIMKLKSGRNLPRITLME